MATSKTVLQYALLGLFMTIMLGGALLVSPTLFGLLIIVIGACGAICCLDDLGYLESKKDKQKVIYNDV